MTRSLRSIRDGRASGLEELRGAVLTGATYYRLSGPKESPLGYHGFGAGLDGGLEAVQLSFLGREPLAISYLGPGAREGLGLASPAWLETTQYEPMVAGDRPLFLGLVNHRVEAIALAIHEDLDEDLAWSLRLGFSAGSLVIALGEAQFGGGSQPVLFSAEELVLIRDQNLAKAFQHPDSGESAWGRGIKGDGDE